LETILAWDKSLFLLINTGWSCSFSDHFFLWVTDGRFWILPGLVAAFFFIRQEKKKAFIILGLTLLLVALTDPLCVRLLKPLFARPRPCDPEALVAGGRFLCGFKHSFSFPSAHAMNSFAAAMLYTCFYPKRWPFFMTLAGLAALSRVVVGVHYPLDVLAGALIGMGCGGLLYCLFVRVNRKTRWLE